MFLITGLGNLGKEYEVTPHNSGYIFVDMFREYLIGDKTLQVSEWENEKKLFMSDICKIKKGGELIGILQKPLTLMNNSGDAVRLLLKKFNVDEYILVHDDLDIPLGRSKISKGKSPKGHKGIMSVESVCKNREFLRVRIGIENRRERVIPGDEYVLIPYSKKELAVLKGSIKDCVLDLSTRYLQI